MKISQLILLVVAVLILTGCFSTRPFVAPPICDGQDSVILKVTDGNPTMISDSLLVVNILAIEEIDNYSSADAKELLGKIRKMVNSNISYHDLQFYLIAKISEANKFAGATVFILAPSIQQMGNLGAGAILSPCDAALITIHLDKQESLLLL